MCVAHKRRPKAIGLISRDDKMLRIDVGFLDIIFDRTLVDRLKRNYLKQEDCTAVALWVIMKLL